MLDSESLRIQVALLVAALAAGCASTSAKAPGTPSATAESVETNSGSARPVSQRIEGGELIPPLLQVGNGQIQAIAVPVHRIESAPNVIQGASTRSPGSGRSSIRATEVPGPAGPTRPGSRGVGVPWLPIPAADPVAPPTPAAPTPSENPGPLAPVLGRSFDSTNFDTSGPLTGSSFIPPDAHATAGPDHVVSVTNVVVQMHDKTGMSLCAIALDDFFSAVPTTTELFDPKILYDQFAERWVVVALERTTTPDVSQILLAVSDDSNPSDPGMACGTWNQFAIDSKVGGFWADYPGFAVDEEAVYVTGNLFAFSDGAYGGSRLWIVDKVAGTGGGFYGGGTATHSSALDPYTCPDCIATTTQPVHIFGAAPTTPNVGTYLVSYSGLSEDFEAGADEFVQIVRIDDPLPLASPKTFTQEFVNVGNLENLLGAGPLPDAPQSGTAQTIEVNDRRALSAVWRNNKLYMTASINPKAGDPDTGETTAHWWILDTTTPSNGTDPPETTLSDQGSIGGEDIAAATSTFFPSVSVNSSDEVALGFSASAATTYAGSYVAVRTPADPAGTVSPSSVLRPGSDYYLRTFSGSQNRWGDYSSVALDPADDCFWVYNQHALTRGSPSGGDGRWGTAFGLICGSCMASKTLSTEVSTDESHRADMITVEGTADVTSGAALVLEIADSAVFEDGFMVESGSSLAVHGGVCPPMP